MKTEEQKPSNPSAFPFNTERGETFEGMELRDYFANSAMQGLMSMEEKGEYNTINDAWNKIAEYSYHMADAMLKQREL